MKVGERVGKKGGFVGISAIGNDHGMADNRDNKIM